MLFAGMPVACEAKTPSIGPEGCKFSLGNVGMECGPGAASKSSTHKSAQQRAKAIYCLQQLQMTDPDDRCSRSRSRTSPVPSPVIPQPNFLANKLVVLIYR